LSRDILDLLHEWREVCQLSVEELQSGVAAWQK
jgi:hypothetical protein